MDVRFLQSAQYELDDAVDYYNAQAPDLGQAFLLEVLASIKRICNFPDSWHVFSSETRRCQLRRFPYGVIYAVENKTVLVIAVSHLHRGPDYWRTISTRVKR
jgi:toxin ParE2